MKGTGTEPRMAPRDRFVARFFVSGAVLATAILLPSLCSAIPITFQDALVRLRAQNGGLLAASAEVDQRREERDAARGLYLPRIEATASATWINDPLILDLDPIRSAILQLHPNVPAAMIPSFRDRIQDDDFQRVALGVTWPIFTGGRILAVNQTASARLDDAREAQRDTEQGLTTELVRRYYGLRLAERVVTVRAEVRDGLAGHLHQAQRLAEEGLIADAERLHAEVAFASADRELKAAHRDLQIMRASVSGILAMDDSLEAASPLFLVSSIEPLAEFRQASLAANPALQRLEASRNIASAGSRVAASAWLPDIYLFGKREMRTADLTVLDPEWAAGIGARWTVFDGFARLHSYQASRLVGDRVEDLIAQARRDIATLVTKRYEELQKALEEYRSLDASLAAARENLRVRNEAFAEGMGTSLDVTDAQMELSRVQIERLAAAYSFDVALAELLEVSGRSERLPGYIQAADVEVGND